MCSGYYKSFVQSSKKKGILIGYGSLKVKHVKKSSDTASGSKIDEEKDTAADFMKKDVKVDT